MKLLEVLVVLAMLVCVPFDTELEDAVQKDSGHASDGPGVEASGRDEASSKETKVYMFLYPAHHTTHCQHN